MSVENKELIRRSVEAVWNGRNVDAVDDIVARDFIVHAPTPDKEIRGPEGIRQQFGMLRAAFPDLEFKIEDQVAEGDRVVTRWTATGTHQGEFQGIPPTGNRVQINGVDIDRIADGKVIECWMNMDELGLMQQLGAVPEPTPAG